MTFRRPQRKFEAAELTNRQFFGATLSGVSACGAETPPPAWVHEPIGGERGAMTDALATEERTDVRLA
jgi:hypothetical protein